MAYFIDYHQLALFSSNFTVLNKASQSLLAIHWTSAFRWVYLSFSPNCQHVLDHQKSKRIPEKHLFLLYWLYQSLWLCGSQQTVENSERDGNTRPLNLPLEKCVRRSGSNRTGHGTTDCVQIRKGGREGCISPPCLFTLYAEYIMRNAGLDEA